MLIKVTQEDIDKGYRKSCFMCPIARATNRALNTTKALVGLGLTYDGVTWFNTPPNVAEFIINFDKDKSSVSPFEFELTEEW